MTLQTTTVPCPETPKRVIARLPPIGSVGGDSPPHFLRWTQTLLIEIARGTSTRTKAGRLCAREVHHCLLSGHTIASGQYRYRLAREGET